MNLKQELVDWVFFESEELKDSTNLAKALIMHSAGLRRDIASYTKYCSYTNGTLNVPEEIIENIKTELTIYILGLISILTTVDAGQHTKIINQHLKEL